MCRGFAPISTATASPSSCRRAINRARRLPSTHTHCSQPIRAPPSRWRANRGSTSAATSTPTGRRCRTDTRSRTPDIPTLLARQRVFSGLCGDGITQLTKRKRVRERGSGVHSEGTKRTETNEGSTTIRFAAARCAAGDGETHRYKQLRIACCLYPWISPSRMAGQSRPRRSVSVFSAALGALCARAWFLRSSLFAPFLRCELRCLRHLQVQQRSIVRITACRRQRSAASPPCNKAHREPDTQDESHDDRHADSRIRNRDRDNRRDHPKSADSSDPDLRHVDQRRRRRLETPRHKRRWSSAPVARDEQ